MIEIVADKESKVNKKNTISIYNKSLRQCFVDDYHKALGIRGYDNLNAKGRNLLSWPVLERNNLNHFTDFIPALQEVLENKSRHSFQVRESIKAVFIRVYAKYLDKKQ
jgi:hypothetical protein